jgi:phosphate transport system substrate-binding protein
MLFNEAIIVSSTDEAASKVEVDRNAIGYTSLGSVTDKVKALSIDGVTPTEENVKNGSYAVSRPFVLAKKTAVENPVAVDFMNFVKSVEGQAVVARSGYITIDNVPSYTAGNVSGRLTLSGSTSVERVIERLREEYIRLNPNVRVEINYNGSSAGIRDCLNDRSDIAMSSRGLKSDELEQLNGVTFALDGIAVVVNRSNEKSNITSENVTRVFKGEVRYWDEI